MSVALAAVPGLTRPGQAAPGDPRTVTQPPDARATATGTALTTATPGGLP